MGHLDNKYTKSLMHFDVAGFTDESGKAWSTVGTAPTISTAQHKFGSSSGFFAGNGYISIPQNSDFDMGSGDFTIEGWVYATATGQANGSYLYWKGGYEIAVFISPASYAVIYDASSNGSSWNLCSGASLGTLTASTWTHWALSRISTNIYAFLGGTLGSTTGVSTNAISSASATAYIGGYPTANAYLTGYLDEFRFSKGVGYYQTAFTPPKKPFMPPALILV